MVGGSRYHLYRAASADPQYRTIREDEFFYDSCLQAARDSITNLVARMSVFGRTNVEMDLRVRPDQPDIYFEAISRNPLTQWDFAQARVTLTDNKSFAFILNCWTALDQRGWNILSNRPSLDAKTVKLIEDHASALGFDRRHFIFLRQDKCRRINPLVPPPPSKGYSSGSSDVDGRKVQLTRVSVGSAGRKGGAGSIIDGDDFIAKRASAGFKKESLGYLREVSPKHVSLSGDGDGWTH